MARADDYVLVQGLRDTRGALERWRARPVEVLGRWLALSLAISAGLLVAVLAVASVATPDPTLIFVSGLDGSAGVADFGRILARNSLVLALHAVACVAGFIAGSSMRHEAERRSGFSRELHAKAGAAAIVWVVLVTGFSLVTQAYVLGSVGADLAANLAITPGVLVATVLPHALIELVAVFLPLAAWLVASRRGEWSELLAATVVTVVVALPMLVASAVLELTLWPELLRIASPLV